jgi:hypothetical protein
VTGDTPAPAKRASPMLDAALRKAEREFEEKHELTVATNAREDLLCKACDILDLGYAAVEEAALGNRTDFLGELFVNVVNYLEDCRAICGVDDHIQFLKAQWTRANL